MNLQAQITPTRRGWLQSAALIGASLACSWALAQKIDDIPPAVANNVPPNFMYMIDNSLSMENVVAEAPYDAATIYTASCPTGTGILVPAANTAATTFDIRVTNSPSTGTPYVRISGTNRRHTSVASSGDRVCFQTATSYYASLNTDAPIQTPAVYTGNYLNWYFGGGSTYGGHPTTGWSNKKVLSSGTVKTRFESAKEAAKSVINGLPVTNPVSLRVGLSAYTDEDGGQLRRGVADFDSALKTTLTGTGTGSIDGITFGIYTPLAETLADIGRYFSTGYNGDVAPASVVNNNSVTLEDFLRQDGRASCLSGASCTSTTATRPITQWCQRSYAVLLTDGRPNRDQAFTNNSYLRDYDRDCTVSNGAACKNSSGVVIGFDRKASQSYEQDGSDYLDDVAKALYDIDLRPDLQPPPLPGGAVRKNLDDTDFVKSVDQPNNLVTYAIGFADTDAINDPLLARTATQGGGLFETAEDTASLVARFKKIVTDAVAKDASAAAVAVTNATISSGSVGYESTYFSGSWYGDLKAFSLSPTTGLKIEPRLWSVRDKLDTRTALSRKIASFNGTSGVPFTSATSFPLIVPTSPRTYAGVINHVRGDDTGEGTVYRKRDYVLGDIINAEPVAVNYEYSGAGNGLTPTVFQAANDGMLHVFDGTSGATGGDELWAYVPRLIHSKLDGLSDLNYQHQYLVDGTPATAVVSGMVSGMTRILVGGLGKGGRGYYALDITDGRASTEAAAATKVKWEFSQASLNAATQGYIGYSYGTPLIVNTADGWRVVVASGYRNDGAAGGVTGGDGRGRVWVLNPDTGAVVKTITTPAGTGYGSSTDSLGLAHLGRLANTAPDAVVQYVYGGDLKGNVWRFDLSPTGSSDAVRIAALTTAPGGTAQPVTAPPVVGPVSGSSTKFYVYVGTGQYFSVDDVPGTAGAATNPVSPTLQQTMYGIVDDTTVASPTMPTRSSVVGGCTGGGDGTLVCQAATQATVDSNFTATANPVNLSTKRGFYMDVPTAIANGRVNTQPALTVGGTLVFVVNQPTNVTCDPGGNSYFFGLSAATGGAVPRVVGGNTYFDAGFRLAYALSSRAVIVTTGNSRRGLFRLSDKTTKSVEINESATGSATYKRIYKRALN